MGNFEHDLGGEMKARAFPTALSVVLLLYATSVRADEVPTGATTEELSQVSRVRVEAGVGLPQPLSLGVSFGLNDRARVYLQGGLFRYPLVGGSQSFGVSSIEVGWRSNLGPHFELSLFSGYRSVFAAMSQVSIPTSLWFQTWYSGVFVGWNYRIGRSLEGAFGLGVEFAVLGGAAMNFNDANGTSWESSPALDRIARWPLPRLTLLRLTYR